MSLSIARMIGKTGLGAIGVMLLASAAHAQDTTLLDPRQWQWPAVAQDPALQQSIINGNYTQEELRNIRAELDILSSVTTRRNAEAQPARGGAATPSAAATATGTGQASGTASQRDSGTRSMPPYMTADVVFRGRTFSGLSQLYAASGATAPGYSNDSIADRSNRVTALIAKGDRLWITWMIEGHHTGELFGKPATGKPVQVREIVMLRFRDGKIAEIETFTDDLSLYVQSGGVLDFSRPAAASK